MLVSLQLFEALSRVLLPEGLLALALIGICLSLLFRAMRVAGILTAIALIVLALSAMPLFANWLMGTLETQHAAATPPRAEVAIVPGGGVITSTTRPGPEFLEAADRVWYAAHLYRSGHVKRIIAVGGRQQRAGRPEAEVMREMLIALGVPSESITIGTASRNTYEYAREARTIMREPQTALLVTSAFQMPRALAVFQKTGMMVEPAPCDFRTRRRSGTSLDWLPDADAFLMTSDAMREWIKYYTYRWRGWL
jgi:uncharacterized SAM-binding protein YcdF (DUF218 family)